MSEKRLEEYVRNIPDFPKKGIQFKDVTTLFKEPEALKRVTDILVDMYKDKGITKVVGIESRGFIMGAILAEKLGAGFIMARKPGKLPAAVVEESYDKEYGTDTIQIHQGSIDENDVVLLHDGISIGSNKELKVLWQHLRLKLLFIPLATIVGTLLFSALASLILKQWSVFDCLAVGSGFAYYSLSSIYCLMLVAIGSGILPSRKASKLDPIEALRTE